MIDPRPHPAPGRSRHLEAATDKSATMLFVTRPMFLFPPAPVIAGCWACALAIGCVAVCGSAGAQTQEAFDAATRRINQVYASRESEVQATRSSRDDLELGRELLTAAKADEEQDPALAAMLRLRAADLQMAHPDGYAAAADALAQLPAALRASRLEREKRLLGLYEKRYRAAFSMQRREIGREYLAVLLRAADDRADHDPDAAISLLREAQRVARLVEPQREADIETRIETLRQIQQRHERRAWLERRLAEHPDDHDSRVELITLRVEADDAVDTARQLLQRLPDDHPRARTLRDALDPPQGLTPQRAIDAAAWWEARFEAAPESNKAALLARLRDAYQRVLDAPGATPQSTPVVKATLSLQRVRQRMADRGIDYIPRFKPELDVPHQPGLIRSYDTGHDLGRVTLPERGGWAAASIDGGVLLFDLNEGLPVRTLQTPGHPTRLVFAPDGQRLLVGGQRADEPGRAFLAEWRVRDGQPTRPPTSADGRCVEAGYTRRRPVFGVIGQQARVILHDADRLLFNTAAPHAYRLDWPTDLAFLAVVSHEAGTHHLRRIDPLDGSTRTLWSGQRAVAGIRVHGQTQAVLLAHDDVAQVIAIKQGTRRAWLMPPIAPNGSPLDPDAVANGQNTGWWLSALALSADGRHAAIAAEPDATIHLYDTTTGEIVQSLDGHHTKVTGLAFTHDGRYLLAAAGQKLHLWGLEP